VCNVTISHHFTLSVAGPVIS